MDFIRIQVILWWTRYDRFNEGILSNAQDIELALYITDISYLLAIFILHNVSIV